MYFKIYFVAALALAAAGCTDDTTESRYSSLRASFTFSPVTSVPPLQGALNGFGEFCEIWADPKFYHFASSAGTAQVNRTATAVYQTFQSIGGFIVGRAAFNEIGAADYPVVCYDRACPNCWYNDSKAHTMRIEENGWAECGYCQRAYDLNNEGIVTEGGKGRKLLRYRVSYARNTLAINN